MRVLTSMLIVAALAGCASRPSVDDTQTPVAQQAAVGDARQRAKAHTDLGLRYLRDNHLNIALDEARIAIEADSSYPLGYNLMGLVQMYLRENRAAEESFVQALRLAPADPEINNNYGWFLCQIGRPEQSISYFLLAAKSPLYATPTKPLANAGACAIAMKDDQAAETHLLAAVRSDVLNVDALYLLADLYYRNGRTTEARMRLAEVHRLGDPTAESAWLGLRIERRLGDREAEARYASQLRKKFSGSQQYQLLMRGQFE